MDTNTYSITYHSKDLNTYISHLRSIQDFMDLYKIGDKSKNNRCLFVTDANVASLEIMKNFTSKFDDDVCGNDCLFVLGSGEPYKTIDTVMTIIDKLLEYNFSKNDVIVAIGGGVIGDITAFAASIYKRGIQVDMVPTTMLAMIDSSIGGKTSCNRDSRKNIIGTYHPAANIYYILDFLRFLPEIQIKSALAEALKTAILMDEEVYDIFKNQPEKIKAKDEETIQNIIIKCAVAKTKLVEKDFTDENERSFLNLGHTFAYALESVVGMGVITHGEAVAWGISRAVCLSFKKNYCSEAFMTEVLDILNNFEYETSAVPAVVKGGGVGDRILEEMHKDKKNLGQSVRVILPRGLKDIIIEDVPDNEILSVLR